MKRQNKYSNLFAILSKCLLSLYSSTQYFYDK